MPQSEPIEQHVLTPRVPDGRKIGEIRLGGGDDGQQGAQDRDAGEGNDQNKGPNSLTTGDALPFRSAASTGHSGQHYAVERSTPKKIPTDGLVS